MEYFLRLKVGFRRKEGLILAIDKEKFRKMILQISYPQLLNPVWVNFF
jgi:hypothetical protein